MPSKIVSSSKQAKRNTKLALVASMKSNDFEFEISIDSSGELIVKITMGKAAPKRKKAKKPRGRKLRKQKGKDWFPKSQNHTLKAREERILLFLFPTYHRIPMMIMRMLNLVQ